MWTYSGYQSHAPFNDFFPISKTKFWWTSVKCFHDDSCVNFGLVSPPRSIVVGSGIIAHLLWQSTCNFAEMKGSYAEKTWSFFESYDRNTFSERNVCEEGGFSIVRKKKTRAVSDIDPPKRKSKKRKISSRWKSLPLKWVALCEDWLFISLLWMQINCFSPQKWFALLEHNPEIYLDEF